MILCSRSRDPLQLITTTSSPHPPTLCATHVTAVGSRRETVRLALQKCSMKQQVRCMPRLAPSIAGACEHACIASQRSSRESHPLRMHTPTAAPETREDQHRSATAATARHRDRSSGIPPTLELEIASLPAWPHAVSRPPQASCELDVDSLFDFLRLGSSCQILQYHP